VLHSQQLNEKPLQPWIIAEKDGPIIAGHCTSMAGLGETCTHVASLLFCIEALREGHTVTEVPAYWKLPHTFNHVSYAQLKEIDFKSAATRKRKFDTSVDISQESATQPQLNTRKMKNPPSADRVQAFFQNLAHLKSNPAIFVNWQRFLQNLGKKVHMTLNTMSFLLSVFYESPAQATHVEAITHDQSTNILWYRFRSGRMTASRIRQQISVISIKWGCTHEKKAIEAFTAQISKQHQNVRIRPSGFIILSEQPHIGASPDAMMSCDCCGKSTVEVKCPFCAKDCLIKDVVDKNFCLQKDQDGKLCLSNSHQYYYQVQTQRGSVSLKELSLLFGLFRTCTLKKCFSMTSFGGGGGNLFDVFAHLQDSYFT
ncbi:LOW QUALITY PROTEIN: hypothetical protein MAR_024476, partial [Mya arenaria]